MMNQISEAAVESVPASTAVPATQEIVDVIEKLTESERDDVLYVMDVTSSPCLSLSSQSRAAKLSFAEEPGIFEFSFTSRKSRP